MWSLRKKTLTVYVCGHKCVWLCGILWNVVSRVMIVQETGVLKPYVLMPHAAAIFSWLRSGVTCAAGIEESYAGQFILSSVKIPFFENRVTLKAWVEYKFISCRCVSFDKTFNNRIITKLLSLFCKKNGAIIFEKAIYFRVAVSLDNWRQGDNISHYYTDIYLWINRKTGRNICIFPLQMYNTGTSRYSHSHLQIHTAWFYVIGSSFAKKGKGGWDPIYTHLILSLKYH